jgi:hypothetical protein
MADKITTLTVADVRALGDRLFARSQSRLMGDDQKHLKADLRTAARLLWLLVLDRAPTDVIAIPGD